MTPNYDAVVQAAYQELIASYEGEATRTGVLLDRLKTIVGSVWGAAQPPFFLLPLPPGVQAAPPPLIRFPTLPPAPRVAPPPAPAPSRVPTPDSRAAGAVSAAEKHAAALEKGKRNRKYHEEHGTELRCSKCSRVFDKVVEYIAHIGSSRRKVHRRPPCAQSLSEVRCACGYKPRNLQEYEQHLRRATKQYKFVCDKCPKGFVTQTDFSRHQRIHTNERPHKCHCGKGFNTKSNLREHKQKVHGLER